MTRFQSVSEQESLKPKRGFVESVRDISRNPEPERVGQRWGFGAFLLVEAVFISERRVHHGGAVELRRDAGESTSLVLVGSMVPTMLAAAVAVVITYVRGNGPVVDLRLSYDQGGPAPSASSSVSSAWSSPTSPPPCGRRSSARRTPRARVGELCQPAEPAAGSAAITMFVYVSFIGPICEEIIYRGLLWGAVERQGWSRLAAFVLTTVIFAVSHLEPLRTSLLLVIAIPIGVARLFTRRLGASIVAHVVNNFLPRTVRSCSPRPVVI